MFGIPVRTHGMTDDRHFPRFRLVYGRDLDALLLAGCAMLLPVMVQVMTKDRLDR